MEFQQIKVKQKANVFVIKYVCVSQFIVVCEIRYSQAHILSNGAPGLYICNIIIIGYLGGQCPEHNIIM